MFKLDSEVILGERYAVNALIETQTILQLMVKKGIVTPEEVVSMRKKCWESA